MKPNPPTSPVTELLPAARTSLAVASANEPTSSLSSVNVGALIEKALDAKSAVEVIKELREMWMEDQRIAAERAFDRALAAFQAECPVIQKGKVVADTGGKRLYNYAPMEEIISQVKPMLQKHGFNYSLDTDVESKDGWVIARCVVTHELGAKRTSTAKFPLGAGTRAMSTTQIFAAALTFASRRVFCNAFGIITGEEDRDGAGEPQKFDPGDGLKKGAPATEAPAVPAFDDDANKRKLVDMTRSVHGIARGYGMDEAARKKLNQYLVDECILGDSENLRELSGARLEEVVKKVSDKLKGA